MISRVLCVGAALAAALPLMTSVTARADVSCYDAAAPITTEEKRLDATMPQGGPAVGPALVAAGGFDQRVSDFEAGLCAKDSLAAAREWVRSSGAGLWRAAVDTAQGRRDGGWLDREDDRPLYWARLMMSKALRQWQPAFDLDEVDRASLLTALDHGSRGVTSVEFPPGDMKRVLVSGFDPFGLDGPGVRASNLSGSVALELDGTVVDTPAGPARVEAVSFPVRWDSFDEGIVEAAFGPALRDRHGSGSRPDLVMTTSQGAGFSIERWGAAWRGGMLDNDNIGRAGPVPPASGVPQPALPFIETTLPVEEMLAADTGPQEISYNELYCFWQGKPGGSDSVCRTDGSAPPPGKAAQMGSAGNFLSNESGYRANRVRIGLGATEVSGGHLHLPQVGEPSDPLALTGPEVEARRTAGIAQSTALIRVAVP